MEPTIPVWNWILTLGYRDWRSLIDARAQLTLSQTGNPGRIALIKNRDIAKILTLNYPQVRENLLRDGVSFRLGYTPSSVELELPYPGNSLQNLLPSLNTKLTVYLTYNDGEDTRPLKEPSGAIYGRYFNFYFTKQSYLTGIREYELQDNQPRGQWICPEELRFEIHRHPLLRQSNKWECQEDKIRFCLIGQDSFFSALMKDQNFIYGKTVKQVKNLDGITLDISVNQKCIRPTNITHYCYDNNPDTAKAVDFEETNCTTTIHEDGKKGVSGLPFYLHQPRNIRQGKLNLLSQQFFLIFQ